MPECDNPCFCHYTYTAACCDICQPPKMAEPENPLDLLWGSPQYNEPESHPNNLKCADHRCQHPQRSHSGGRRRICLIASCRCPGFAQIVTPTPMVV